MATIGTPLARELPIVRGGTFQLTETIRNTDGTLFDLTGATAQLTTRPRFLRRVLASLTESAGLTLGGALGTVLITLSVAQTTALEPGDFPANYTLMVTKAGITYTILNGVATLAVGEVV